MADIAETPAVAQEATTPKKGAKKTKVVRAKANHPPTAVMVNSAIKSLKERGGSSLQAIKKYVASTYKVDAEKLAPFIKKFIKSSVASGALVQTKGKGASGSFKLAATVVSKKPAVAEKKVAKPAAKSPKKAAPAVKTSTRRAPTARKEVPKRGAPKKPAPKPKSPAKAKKPVVKTPVKKTMVPKAKTVKKSPAKAKRATPKRK